MRMHYHYLLSEIIFPSSLAHAGTEKETAATSNDVQEDAMVPSAAESVASKNAILAKSFLVALGAIREKSTRRGRIEIDGYRHW